MFKGKKQNPNDLPAAPPSPVTNDLDITKFYAGYDFRASDQIVIHHPTVGEIIEYGESEYYKMVYSLTAIPSDRISELWEMGIDFTKVSDIEFFLTHAHHIQKKHSLILFGEALDFSKFDIGRLGDELVLYEKDAKVVIDPQTLSRITSFLCQIHRIKKERVEAAGKLAMAGLVDVDRQEKELLKTKASHSLVLLPLISSMENSPGFKYRLTEIMNMPIFHFMDSVQRISLITSVNQIAIGHYTGSFDQKKFKPEKALNWTCDLYE